MRKGGAESQAGGAPAVTFSEWNAVQPFTAPLADEVIKAG